MVEFNNTTVKRSLINRMRECILCKSGNARLIATECFSGCQSWCWSGPIGSGAPCLG